MASENDRDAYVGASGSVTASRRSFLAVAGAATCVVFTRGVAHALSSRSEGGRETVRAAAKSAAQQRRTSVAASHALARTLRVGTELHTSRVVAVHPITLGAIAVVLQRSGGGAFQLDVLRRSEHDGSIAQSSRYSVFAVNGGTGHSQTSEPDGLAAMALARMLAEAEQAGMAGLDLLTHADRVRRYPVGAFEVSV